MWISMGTAQPKPGSAAAPRPESLYARGDHVNNPPPPPPRPPPQNTKDDIIIFRRRIVNSRFQIWTFYLQPLRRLARPASGPSTSLCALHNPLRQTKPRIRERKIRVYNHKFWTTAVRQPSTFISPRVLRMVQRHKSASRHHWRKYFNGYAQYLRIVRRCTCTVHVIAVWLIGNCRSQSTITWKGECSTDVARNDSRKKQNKISMVSFRKTKSSFKKIQIFFEKITFFKGKICSPIRRLTPWLRP